MLPATVPTVYDTNRRACALGLSFAQMKALDWMSTQHPPIFRRDWRRAGVTTATINSLEARRLVAVHSDTAGAYWVVSNEGRAALDETKEPAA